MSFPDGQPRPDETPSDQDLPQAPDQPQPPFNATTPGDAKASDGTEALPEAGPTDDTAPVFGTDASPDAAAEDGVGVPYRPYSSPSDSAPLSTPQQPYGAPYATPSDAASEPTSTAAPSAPRTPSSTSPYETPQGQPFGAPQGQPYGTPQGQPYGTPQGQPYGAPQGQQPYGAPYGSAAATATKPLSIMAIIGLVLGVLGLLISWIPFVNFLAYLFAIPALVLGIIAIVKSGANGTTRGRGFGVGATILAVLTLLIAVGTQFLYASLYDHYSERVQQEVQRIEEEQNNPPSPLPDTDAPLPDADDLASGANAPLPIIDSPDSTVGGEASGVSQGEGAIADGKYYVKFISATKAGKDWDNKPTVMVTYEVTNKQASDGEFNLLDTTVIAFQNGRELEIAVFGVDKPEGYDSLSFLKEIKPGATKTVTLGFVLLDESAPVTFEAEGLFSDGKVVKEFSIQ